MCGQYPKEYHSKEKATGLNGKFYIKTDTHTFENNVHTMKLDLSWKNTMEDGDGTSKDSQKKELKMPQNVIIWQFYRISFGEKL